MIVNGQNDDKEKIMKKIEKTVQKKYKKFLKRIKVPKDADIEKIKEYILEYVRTTNENILDVHISEEIRQDQDFMLKLFETNPAFTIKYGLRDNEMENMSYVVKFTKFKFDYYSQINSNSNNALQEVLHYQFLENPEYITGVANLIPDQNFIKTLNYLIVHKPLYRSNTENFEKLINNLPVSFLCEQAEKYGYEVLIFIPRTYKNYNEVLSKAVECDGFKSLSILKVGDILQHKDLIIKAAELFGREKLYTYLKNTISPEKYRHEHQIEINHEKILTYYSQVQKILLSDPQICEILYTENEQKNNDIDKNL